jgi:hypothetical protein
MIASIWCELTQNGYGLNFGGILMALLDIDGAVVLRHLDIIHLSCRRAHSPGHLAAQAAPPQKATTAGDDGFQAPSAMILLPPIGDVRQPKQGGGDKIKDHFPK